MLTITIPDKEFYNEKTNEFIPIKGGTLYLEHSLHSLAEWESKWKKPFLDNKSKTMEETIDYIKCMTVDKDGDDSIYVGLSNSDVDKIQKYIDESRTATWFNNNQNTPPSREIITAEIIYYWMIAQNVPFECEYWHLSRLMTLLRVCNIKNAPKKQKMSKKQTAANYRALNAARRKQMGTTG